MWGAKRKWGGKPLAFPPAHGKALRSHFASHKILSRSKAVKIPCIGPSRLWYCYIINVPPLHASLEDSSGLQDITEMNCIDFECTFSHTIKQYQRIPCSGWPFANWTRKTLERTAHDDRGPHPGDVDMAVLWEFYHIRAWAMTYLLKLAPKINACELIIKETPTSWGKTLVPMNPALLGWI